jgi:hypothetical protein
MSLSFLGLSIFVTAYGILTGVNVWKALERKEKEKEIAKKLE